MELDETTCGSVLCQHPACWQTNLRFVRKIPRTVPLPAPIPAAQEQEEEDEGLPTQKIVNLLGNLQEDDVQSSRFTSSRSRKSSGRGLSSLPSFGSKSESYPSMGMMAPQVTPASPMRTTIADDVIKMTTKREKGPPVLHTVEVQEVFDLDDLHMNWQETFKPKKYYVWVQNQTQMKNRHVSPMQQIPISRLRGGPAPLSTKDLTEKMVPQEVQYMREQTVIHDDVWPVIKERKIRNLKSATGGQPYKIRKRRDKMILMDEEIYQELVGLPQSLLSCVFRYVDPSTITTKEKMREVLERVVPMVEKENTALSLATGEVLKQQKLTIHDGQSKLIRQPELHQVKQVYLLDGGQEDDKMSTAHDPDDMHDAIGDLSDLSSYDDSPRDINKHKPLPAITGLEKMNISGTPRSKIPAISLGLPAIPPGTRVTRPFRYTKDAQHDFMLDKIPTPPPVERPRSETPMSLEPGSTIHVTVPSMQTEVDEVISPTQLDIGRHKGSQGQMSKSQEYSVTSTQDTASRPSPTTGSVTIPSRQMTNDSSLLLGEAGVLSLSSTKSFLYRDNSIGSGQGHPRPPVNTPNTAALKLQYSNLSPEHTGLLDTIHEIDQDGGQTDKSSGKYSQQQSLPKNARMVRFAQPPETPAPASTPRDADSVFIIPPVPSPLYVSSPDKKHAMSPGFSPEPWPLIEEEDYTVPLTPRVAPQNPRQVASPIHVPAAVSGEAESQSPLSTSPTREGSYHDHLVKKIMQADRSMMDSPAPPPPSPEPSDRKPSAALIMKDGIPMSLLDDALETDSELTLSALPPSNLDDLSRITTPADMSGRSRPASKGDPNKLGEGLLNMESLARSRPASKGDPVTPIQEEPKEWTALHTVSEEEQKTDQSKSSQQGQTMRHDQDKGKPSADGEVSDAHDQTAKDEETKDETERGGDEITEDGGDNAAFKDELRLELDKFEND